MEIKQKTLFGEEFEDWEFAKANTTYLTHGIHPYPARMIPQIANRLIQRYSKQNDLVVDPFSGSGTVNLESMLNKRYSYGFDINPLAHLIQKVKTTPIEDETLNNISNYFKKTLSSSSVEKVEIEEQPSIPNIDLWFKDYVVRDLLVIKSLLNEFDLDATKNFLNLIFSKTISDVANIDKGDNPYFIRSLKDKKLNSFNPDVRRSFLTNLNFITQRTRKLSKKISDEKLIEFKPKLYLKDSRKWVFKDQIANAIITSPPYGEEKNTMSYMRFAKLCLYWLGWKQNELKELEKRSLGANNEKNYIKNLKSETLNDLLSSLESKSQEKRAKEVISFFNDYYELMKKAYFWLKDDGNFCIVIGNRSAKRIPVLNDKITTELGNDIGFSHLKTYYRNIPCKFLPKHDDKTKLINAESIIILKK
jgi:DNA modification methylase